MFAFVAAHHAEIVYAIGALFTALNLAIRLALFFHPLADWVSIAQRQPRLAALVRLLDALGISPVSVLQALVDLVRGEASKGTLASARAMQVSASKPLISPPKGSP